MQTAYKSSVLIELIGLPVCLKQACIKHPAGFFQSQKRHLMYCNQYSLLLSLLLLFWKISLGKSPSHKLASSYI